MDKITTTSVSNGFAKVEEFLLSDTPQTAIVFQPELHQGGVRGKIIRFKKNRNGERVRPVSVDFKTLKENEGISIELPSNTELTIKGIDKCLVGEFAERHHQFFPLGKTLSHLNE